jgi:ABC-2 type transport system ATP-binding protein
MAPVEVRDLSKRFGPVLAVNNLSFDVSAGRVTGFLGPNGAGKSTTLRALLGLVRPTAGTATFAGLRYEELDRPSTKVGAVLEDASFHPGRTARNHLRVLAATGEHPFDRVDAVLADVGLTEAADRRVGGYSMGMRQRLGIAAALLGDPQVLIFDEPVNGLDPEGIRWVRDLMRSLAAEGRAVLVSSHLMSEMAQTADHLVVIGRGKLVADTAVSELVRGEGTVLVRTPDPGFARLLATAGATVRDGVEASLVVSGMTSAEIGKLAAYHGVALAELTPQRVSLEDAFMELTKDSVEYQGAAA